MDALDAFLDELRAAGSAVDAPAPNDALQTLFRDGTVSSAPAPLSNRRRPLLRVAVASAVGAFAFGGLGVAGALPGPVQTGVADVADFVGVNLPDGNPGHGGDPPAAPPAAGKPRQNQKQAPGEKGQRPDEPGQQGDDPGDNGRHVGPDGTPPSTVPEGRSHANDEPTQSFTGNGWHRGWSQFPPTTTDTTPGPPESARTNRGGSN
jgi:hypothetical protein